MRRTETGGHLLPCVCKGDECTSTVEVETFPGQDIVVLGINDGDGVDLLLRLSDLRRAIAEEAT